jgi:hypothetical protein
MSNRPKARVRKLSSRAQSERAPVVTNDLDKLTFSVVRLDALFDDQPLSHATGFYYYGFTDNKPTYWLVTNWHVFSGRDPETLKSLSSTVALPNRLRLNVPLSKSSPLRAGRTETFLFQEQTLEIYDGAGQAVWYQHKERGSHADVAVANLGGAAFGHWDIVGINQIASQNDMKIEIGNDVHVLGYPLGFSHFMNTPVWKKGSIASEPHMETSESRGRIIIDATTREGMSGSPVVMRAKTHYISEDGSIKAHPNATRLIGVYASRPILGKAEIGYVYKSGLIEEVIKDGIRGPNWS